MSWQNFDVTGGAPGGFGGWGGYGGAGGAFAGALVGGVLGPALFGRGYGHDGGRHSWGGEGVVQINAGGHHGSNIGQWELFKEMSDTRREVALNPFLMENALLQQTIANNSSLQNLMMEIGRIGAGIERDILLSKFDNALQLAGISREMAECCCKQLMATTVMGFETQLRDQAMHNQNMLEHRNTQCLIKDTAKDGIIARQAERISALELAGSEARIINAVTANLQPARPVPAYIQANPYENYVPTVRALPPCPPPCAPRWDFNNAGNFA